MKLGFALLLMVFSFAAAHADPACGALSAFVGTYKQISADCDNVEGADTNSNKFIRVEPFQTTNNGVAYSAFWIVVADPSDPVGTGTGDGPSTDPKDRFQCIQNGSAVSVAGPYNWNYSFSGTNLEIDGLGCKAIYSKIN